MDDCRWPLHLLDGFNIPRETLCYLNSYAIQADDNFKKLTELHDEIRNLESLSKKKDRYIEELEKQLSLLQKTLDLVDRNTKGVREDGRNY